MSDLHIVGVHGIWQGDTDTTRLTADWRAALTRGLTRHLGPHTTIPPMTVPHYSPAFTAPRRRLGAAKPTDHEPIGPNEEAFILETLAHYAPDAPVRAAADAPSTLGLGLPYLPRPVAAAIAGIDRESGRGTGALLVGAIRQVHKYLHHPDRAEQIRATVLDAFTTPGTRLAIAHSLGSVVVLDMILRGQIPPADGHGQGLATLVTCGSPLAWPTVRRGIGQEGRSLRLPDGIAWINLHARGDAIAQARGLASVAPDVHDVEVSNGLGEPHAATRYLDKEPIARTIAADGQ
ncbi:hypothetical protein [Kitasatospora sp. NPDC088548]|uniref:hypothetical protein n=1 Tax=Kitasatospora sp. NPDC088548 TaxID=3364075 RepID=UPI00380FC1A8